MKTRPAPRENRPAAPRAGAAQPHSPNPDRRGELEGSIPPGVPARESGVAHHPHRVGWAYATSSPSIYFRQASERASVSTVPPTSRAALGLARHGSLAPPQTVEEVRQDGQRASGFSQTRDRSLLGALLL